MSDQDPSVPTPPPNDEVLAAAARERRAVPTTDVEAADLADKYEQMLRLADLLDDTGAQMREWARIGGEVLADPDVAASAELSRASFSEAEEEIRAATTGKHGLLSRSIELDADALVLRATVLTYRWIDDLQTAAYQTLGSIAGKAIGYLAPEVALGGAIVAAGLIETDALDRDGVANYLSELAESNPELMEHVTTGGGLLDSLQMRALLTAGVLSGDTGRQARAGGLRAAGVASLPADFDAALRDAAIGLTDPEPMAPAVTVAPPEPAPADLAGLMTLLSGTTDPVRVQQVADGRYLVFLPGMLVGAAAGDRPRLVTGDQSAYVADLISAIGAQVSGVGDDPARVMLVGAGAGGAAAVAIATAAELPGFVVEQVVTASSPSAQVPRLPTRVRVLSIEDRSDPVALLGSLINAATGNRLTVVYDATQGGRAADAGPYVIGGRAADRADHPEVRAEIARLRDLGYLAA